MKNPPFEHEWVIVPRSLIDPDRKHPQKPIYGLQFFIELLYAALVAGTNELSLKSLELQHMAHAQISTVNRMLLWLQEKGCLTWRREGHPSSKAYRWIITLTPDVRMLWGDDPEALARAFHAAFSRASDINCTWEQAMEHDPDNKAYWLNAASMAWQELVRHG